MKLIRLLILGAGGAYLYKRFSSRAPAGAVETERAEPFSSESLDAAPQTLTQPTWLKPADA